MTDDQQHLLEEGDRLDELHRSYDGDAKLNESFLVLTLGASLIAHSAFWPTTLLL